MIVSRLIHRKLSYCILAEESVSWWDVSLVSSPVSLMFVSGRYGNEREQKTGGSQVRALTYQRTPDGVTQEAETCRLFEARSVI